MTQVHINDFDGAISLSNEAGSNLDITAFDPSDLLAASLAKCTGGTVRRFARNKGYDISKFAISVDLDKDRETKTANFVVHLDVEGNLTEAELKSLHKVARKSYISRLLFNQITLKTEMQYDGNPINFD